MNKKQLIAAWVMVLLIISIIIGFGFQKYYLYSNKDISQFRKGYVGKTAEWDSLTYLKEVYKFDKSPTLRIISSILIIGGLLIYTLRDKKE